MVTFYYGPGIAPPPLPPQFTTPPVHLPASEEDILSFARRLDFHPDPLQAQVLRSTAKRGILNCTRQWGKSTLMALKAVHRAFTRPDSLVLVACPTARQSGEWMKKARAFLLRLGLSPRSDGSNPISLALPNGSRIVGLPGANSEARVRGFSSVSLLLIDEAARLDDSLYKALRPMVAVANGEIWMMSTPFGKRGFFYDTWTISERESAESWTRLEVRALDCPRISREFLEEERTILGSAWFDQEYQCRFIDNGSSIFSRELVEAALDDTIEPLDLPPWPLAA